MKQVLIVGTHSGSFHADDVFGVVVARLAHEEIPYIRVIRSRLPEDWARCDIVLDVGDVYNPEALRFDHHQASFDAKRDYGECVPYAAAGLMWKHFGHKVVENFLYSVGHQFSEAQMSEVWQAIDESLVQYLDMADIGMRCESPGALALYTQVSFFNRDADWDENTQFEKAVQFVEQALLNQLYHVVKSVADVAVVMSSSRLLGGRVLMLDTSAKWSSVVTQHMPNVLYVIYPAKDAQRTCYMVQVVPTDEKTFACRKSLPESWAGLRDADLAALTGVKDAIFCHRGRFIAGAGSADGALRLAELALKG